ncbi:MAG: hypothetical protein MK083_03245 [Dehalococcoidia bacterium]|nr:hypothetical protein [Dehalococcoidia bacterium]
MTNQLEKKIKSFSSQNIIDAMSVLGWDQTMIHGSKTLFKGKKIFGEAVTLRFVHFRKDLLEDLPKKHESPEYKAFELCGPGKVLVASSVGPWESIGGDIKFLRLFQKKVAGIVTDGSVRDSKELEKYNLPIFAHSFTSKQGPGIMLPFSVNDSINCGGILVRPGDYILGDDDGVVVFPKKLLNEIVSITEEREEMEIMIKDELIKNPESPGKYYPFNDDTYKLYEELKKQKSKNKFSEGN